MSEGGADGGRHQRFGDLLGRLLNDPVAPDPGAALGKPRELFDDRIRACAAALNEDPEELLRLARGTTRLARLVRLLLGDLAPPRSSSDEVLNRLYEQAGQEGLKGERRLTEVVRRSGRSVTPAAVKQAVRRCRQYKRNLAKPETLAELLSLEFSSAKPVKLRGPKPKRRPR